jgi:membrane-bound lytic murein transglycosylase B
MDAVSVTRTGLRTLAVIIAATWTLPFAAATEPSTPTLSPVAHAVEKLRASGASEEWIAFLKKNHAPEDRDRIVELNVLGFLGKADYSSHRSKRALRKCKAFLRKYRVELARAEARHGVPREVIAALLWVETKHGTHIGKHSIADVYFSLLQADHPDVIKATFAALSQRAPAGESEYHAKILERSSAKAAWALAELASLEKIRRLRPNHSAIIKGSYAGAFGIPQFIPSSYLRWATKMGKGKRLADLFKMGDAIQSVAFYLKSNGWKTSDAEARRKALYHYNRADAYGEVILKIAHDMNSRKFASQ